MLWIFGAQKSDGALFPIGSDSAVGKSPVFVLEELTLLANRFLSVHVFMVAKVGWGLGPSKC